MEVTLMAHRQAGGLPATLLHRPIRVLRPQDAVGAYAHPRPEFARLERLGVLHRLATGYYAAVPDDRIGQSSRAVRSPICRWRTGSAAAQPFVVLVDKEHNRYFVQVNDVMFPVLTVRGLDVGKVKLDLRTIRPSWTSQIRIPLMLPKW
jgi:hypothetical protein